MCRREGVFSVRVCVVRPARGPQTGSSKQYLEFIGRWQAIGARLLARPEGLELNDQPRVLIRSTPQQAPEHALACGAAQGDDAS